MLWTFDVDVRETEKEDTDQRRASGGHSAQLNSDFNMVSTRSQKPIIIRVYSPTFGTFPSVASSVQESVYALTKAHISSTLLSELSLQLPLKQFQCWSDRRWLFLTLSRKSPTASSFLPCLLQAIGRWCDAHSSGSSSSTRKLFQLEDFNTQV